MKQASISKTIPRYSSAFKRKVVGEIESGETTVETAKRIYDIRGATTIPRWLKQFGKNHLLNRVVRIEMKDEKDTIKIQQKKIRELQAALSDAHLKIIVLESTITVLEQKHGEEEKKSSVTKSSKSR